MYIEHNSIIFNSIPKYWNKEHDGRKPNTVREIPPEDVMNFGLNVGEDGILYSRTKEIPFIIIENTETKERFYRKLTDVSLFNMMWVFSWTPETK